MKVWMCTSTIPAYTERLLKAKPGFSTEVDIQLLRAIDISSCSSTDKLVILLMDVKVFNKHTGKMVGFVDLGDLNNQLTSFEKDLNIPF